MVFILVTYTDKLLNYVASLSGILVEIIDVIIYIREIKPSAHHPRVAES